MIRIKQLLEPSAATDQFSGKIDEKHRLRDGDLVFSWSATLAVVRWWRGEAVLNQHLFRVLEVEGIDRAWLGYALEASLPTLSSMTHGTTMKHITKKTLDEHRVPVPSMGEQQAIADLLEHADRVVAASLIARESASHLYRALAADGYDATTATVMQLGDLVTLQNNRRMPIKADDRAKIQGAYPYCGANGVLDHINDFRFDGPLILLAEDGGDWGPHASSAYEMTGRFWVNNHAHVLSPNKGVDRRFLLHALNRINMRPWVTGTTRGKLTTSALKSVEVKLPELDVQIVLARRLDAQMKVVKAQTHAHVAVVRARESLIREVVFGKTPLPSAYDRFLADNEKPQAPSPHLVTA